MLQEFLEIDLGNGYIVIVPIYGVDKCIERCLRSLLGQTKTDGAEFILVNDCTEDCFMEVAEMVITDYPDVDIKVINHEKNRGLAALAKRE